MGGIIPVRPVDSLVPRNWLTAPSLAFFARRPAVVLYGVMPIGDDPFNPSGDSLLRIVESRDDVLAKDPAGQGIYIRFSLFHILCN